MAVLAEAISVIVRKSSVDQHLTGGQSAFLRIVPNASLCGDADLFRVGFMRPDDVRAFVEKLIAFGLVFEEGGKCVDLAVVDQRSGSTLPCEWLQFARVAFGQPDSKVSICWYFSGERLGQDLHLPSLKMNLSVPSGWQYEGSISQTAGFISNSDVSERLEFLREEGQLLVYWDREACKEVYIGRTT